MEQAILDCVADTRLKIRAGDTQGALECLCKAFEAATAAYEPPAEPAPE